MSGTQQEFFLGYYALAPRLKNEVRRQAAVDQYGVASRRPEAARALVVQAAQLFDAPIGLATIIDRSRQIVVANHGLDIQQTDRDTCFCAHTIAYPEAVMCVLDASKDPRFAGNPFVQRDPRVRFYIGAPLVSPCGEALGALCVIDTRTRDGLVLDQADALKELAARVTRTLLA